MAKTASLQAEPPDRFALQSTYDPALVALIKNMPVDQRAWHAGRRVWLIHISRHGYVLAVLQQLHYQVTDHVEAAFGRLTSWTEVVEAAHDDDPHGLDDMACGTPPQAPEVEVEVLHGALEAHRQRLQTFDFESWLEQAIEDEGDFPL